MAKENVKLGICNITYNIRLYTNYLEYFKLTNEKFNELILEYYNLLFYNQELLKNSSRDCRAKLEQIVFANDDETEYIPSRFRRAAMMQAIGQARAYFSKLENSTNIDEDSKYSYKIKAPSKAKEFHIPATFYQEMYKYLEDRKVQFKLYNGESWKWYESKFSKWNIPKEATMLSPSIKIYKKFVMVSIPVKFAFKNLTSIKDRMQDKDLKLCAIAFSGRNNIATCVVVDSNGKFVKSLFVHGGDEYKYLTSQAMRRIKKNNHNTKNSQKVKGYNKKYWRKLSKYRNHFAHVISKKIVDFCIENDVQVIAISGTGNDMDYLKYAKNFNPVTLRERITNYTKYKAFKNNILMTYVSMSNKMDRCYKCNSVITRNITKRTDKKIKEDKAVCENRSSCRLFL